MRRIILFAAVLLMLVACQSGDEAIGPRTIIEWEPAPYDDRPPPAEVTLPTPETASQSRPDFPEIPEVVPIGLSEIPEMAPTPVSPFVYISEANGFAVPYPSSWEILDSTDNSVELHDPVMDVSIEVFSELQDEETSWESLLDLFLDPEFIGDISLANEKEISFAGEGLANSALLINEDSDGFGFWLAFAEEGAHVYTFMAFGDAHDLEARQASLEAIVKQVEPGGANIYGLPKDETLILLGGDPIPRQLDPARQTGAAAGYIGLLYSGLVRLTPELQVEPDLAKSWTVNEDGTIYTFTLRDDLAFHSGKPITAADFQYSWERATDPETDSTTAATYLGDILGVPEKLSGEADTIAGIEIVDDQTIVVMLDGPKPYFLLKLTYPTSFVIDRDSVDPEEEDWVFEPNASGPYALNTIHEESAIIFERNENYHTLPPTPNVIYMLYQVGSSISLFESGELDIVGLGGSEAERVRQPADELNDRWISSTSMCTSYVQLNSALPPMDDHNVRLAFSLALDKEALNQLVNEGLDVVAESILPPAMPGYSVTLVQELSEREYGPEAAQAALAASEYASGLPPITFTAGGYGTAERDDINALVAAWETALNADITVEYVDPQDYSRAARENHGHMVNYGWCADYPDPENFLDVLFQSESEFNIAGYSNPELDALLEEARVELDPAQRLDLYQRIEAMLLEDVAAIPLNHGVSDVLVNPRVKGYVLPPMSTPIIHLLYIEPLEGGE